MMVRSRAMLGLVALLVASVWGSPRAAAQTNQNGPQREESAGVDAEGAVMMAAAEAAIQRSIERAAPAVVAIARVRRDGRQALASEFNFNAPGIPAPLAELVGEDFIPTEFGSGVILSADGAILTCYHVLDDPEENDYYVWVPAGAGADAAGSGRAVRMPAQVVAADPWTDLAVIKVDARDLPVMPMGDASRLRRGSFVVALGNPYATAIDGRASASWGIVANLQRRAPAPRARDTTLAPPESLQEYGTLIQSDVRLNLGTSGGALINLRGEMVGLTTSLAALAGYEQAAGYAIAIDEPMRRIIDQLREGRTPAFGFLGVEPVDALGRGGALVRRVAPGMAADEAGIRPGDVIVAIEGDAIRNAEALFREISRRPAENVVRMTVSRNGGTGEREVAVRLGKKWMALGRPGYNQVPEPTWRGMQVDLASAMPPDRLMLADPDRSSDTIITRVDPDTPAWRAGLRQGQFVTAVAGQAVHHPDQFHQAVAEAQGPVRVEIEGRFGNPQTVTVSDAVPDPTAQDQGSRQ